MVQPLAMTTWSRMMELKILTCRGSAHGHRAGKHTYTVADGAVFSNHRALDGGALSNGRAVANHTVGCDLGVRRATKTARQTCVLGGTLADGDIHVRSGSSGSPSSVGKYLTIWHS